MLRIITITTIIVVLKITATFSQTNQRSISIDLGGSGGIGSINYEQFFKKKAQLFWKVGLSGFPGDKNNGFITIIPCSIGGLIGKETYYFEWGVGQGISISTNGSFFARTTPTLGYRFHKASKPFYLGIKYTPLISNIFDFQYQNWGGITLGYQL